VPRNVVREQSPKKSAHYPSSSQRITFTPFHRNNEREHERIATSPDRKFIRRGSRLPQGTSKGFKKEENLFARELGIMESKVFRPRRTGVVRVLFDETPPWHQVKLKHTRANMEDRSPDLIKYYFDRFGLVKLFEIIAAAFLMLDK
jgi:hypothetical protein